MLKAPIPYSPDVEKLDPQEAETSRKLTETFEKIIDTTHKDYGDAMRGVHAKSHALLEGELTVHADLPPELAQGIFQPGRTYPVLIRMSAIPGDPIRDSVSLPRGFSFKVIGVEGERLPTSEGEVTQDFVFATGAVFSAPTPEKFLPNVKLLSTTTDKAEGAKEMLSKVLQPIEKALEAVGIKSAKITAFGGYPNTNPIGDRYYSQAPFRFGDYIAKFDVSPESPNFRLRADQKIDQDKGPNAIRDLLKDIFAMEGGAWTMRAQLCRDLEENLIEDAATEWPEAENPYLPIATITVKPQTSWSSERAQVVDEQTAFRPWHGIMAHQPLGGVNRSRRSVYLDTQNYRSKLNGLPVARAEPATQPRLKIIPSGCQPPAVAWRPRHRRSGPAV